MWRNLLLSILLCSGATAAQLKPVRGTQLVHRGNHLARGLVAYYPMNEGGGTQVWDASGNGHQGTIAGAVWAAGRYGPCLEFDGDTAEVGFGHPNLVNAAPAMSLAVWVKSHEATAGANRYISRQGNSGGNRVFYCMWDTGENVNFVAYNDVGSQAMGRFDDGILDTEWHYIVGTYDGSNVQVYVDAVMGTRVESLSGPLATDSSAGTDEFAIGNDGEDSAWYGLIKSVAIYSRALTASEIQSLYRDPYQLFRREPVELYVTTGGAPPASTEQIQVITIASIPAGIVLLSLGVAYSDRRRAA